MVRKFIAWLDLDLDLDEPIEKAANAKIVEICRM
ncbi:hypothetical protein RSAG8_13680, partial [Rhizoctonia solani AG-8 WAC10335]